MPLKVIRQTLQFTRSEKIQIYSTVVWYSLMLQIKDSKVDENYVHQLAKITFHFIALITSKSVGCMGVSGYINTDWWIRIIKQLAPQPVSYSRAENLTQMQTLT